MIFDNADLGFFSRHDREMIRRIQTDYQRLEEFFEHLSASPRRIKPIAELPFETSSIPHELATVYALRGLLLAEGAAALIQKNLHVPTWPIIRSMHELAAAVVFANETFIRTVLKGTDWKRFDEIARRLLLGGSPGSGPRHPVVKVGEMNAELRKVLTRMDPDAQDRRSLREMADETWNHLCDATHPTQVALLGHHEVALDGRSSTWHRRVQEPPGTMLIDLELSLGLIVRFLDELRDTAEKVLERGAAGADTPEARRSTVSFLEMILSDPEVELSSESRYKMEAYRNHLTVKLAEDAS